MFFKSRRSSDSLRNTKSRKLSLEVLEDRTLLSISPSFNGNNVSFNGAQSDSLYLKTDANFNLLFHDSSTSVFSPVQNSGQNYNLGAHDSTIQVQVGSLQLQGLSTNGKALSVFAPQQSANLIPPKADLVVGANIDTQGGSLNLSYFKSITITTGTTLSTRNLGGSMNFAGASSTGASGKLTLEVENLDPFNPILNPGTGNISDTSTSYPHIIVNPSSQILAGATGGFKPGDVSIKAINTNYTLDGLTFPSLSYVSRAAAVTFVDGTNVTPSTVTGGNVSITATSGDIPVNNLLAGLGQNTDNAWKSWGPWVNSILTSALTAVNLLPGFNLATLPVSIDYRNSAAGVTVGQYTQISGDQGITISSSSIADATGQAIYSYNTVLGAAVAFMMGVTDAETLINANAQIISAHGNVNIGSTANSTAVGTARVTQNIPVDSTAPASSASPTNPNHIQLSFSVGLSEDTAHSILSPQAKIEAGGNVDFESNGASKNKQNAQTASYKDGRFGSTVAVNVTKSDILAQVAGTIVSAGTTTTPSLSFNPYTDLDFANSAIRVPAATYGSYATGQRLAYDSGNGGAVGGLTSGNTYYVVINAGLPNEIQLAASIDDALAGKFIAFDSYPTLSGLVAGTQVTVPVTTVDDTTNVITFGFNPGFTNGQALTYTPVAGKRIGGLQAGTYYAVVNSANPTGLQLAIAQAGSVVPLSLDPAFDGLRQTLPITLAPNGTANTIQFGFNAGFQLGDWIVYQGNTISGLVQGATYYVIPTGDPTMFQLAASFADASAGNSLSFGPATATPANLVFDPDVSIDTNANTVEVGMNYAAVPGTTLTNGAPLIYHSPLGNTIAGLQDGATYYVIQDSQNPRLMRLTTIQTDPANSLSAAQVAYNAGVNSFNADYQQAFNIAYGAAIAAGQNTTDATTTATASAQQSAVTLGSLWTAQGIDSARAGSVPPINTFPVTVSSSTNTIDFGFDPGFVRRQPVVYEGPAPNKTAITGLIPGTTYYVLIPDLNHRNIIQLSDVNSNPITLSGVTSSSILLGSPYTAPVTVGTNTITFGSDPTDPFDPSLVNGSLFYQGNGFGLTGLTNGTYFVHTTNTPGVIQLATTPNGSPITLTPSNGLTTIQYVTPFAPIDTRPVIVTSFESFDQSVMSGIHHTLTATTKAGVTINAGLSTSELTQSQVGIGSDPKYSDKLTKPEFSGASVSNWLGSVGSTKPAPASANTTANSTPSDTVSKNLAGTTGSAPDFRLAGAFVAQVVLNNVHADVTGSAVIVSAANVALTTSFKQKTQNSSISSISKPDQSKKQANPTSVALSVTVGVYVPTVTSTIDDGAQIDAGGKLTVSAATKYPFLVPTNDSDARSYLAGLNPLTLVTGILFNNLFGLSNQIFNNQASAAVSFDAKSKTTKNPVSLAGNIQVLVYVNDTEATIGNALINQKASYTDSILGGLTPRNPNQAVAVAASTEFDNLAQAGKLNFDFTPFDFKKNWKDGKALTLYGDIGGTTGNGKGTGFGASIYVNALDNTTVAEIKSGAKIGVGTASTLDVTADQKIIAISLIQAGAAAGDVGFIGSANWYNLTSTTRAQIDDGVTVSALNASNVAVPAGAVNVHADDATYIAGLTGSVIKASHIGVGFSVAVNNVSRTTLAVIGSTGTPTQNESINASSLNVHADSSGVVASLSYAASTTTTNTVAQPTPPAPSSANADPLSGQALPTTVSGSGSSDAMSQSGQRGYGISGDAAGNVLQSDTEAYINAPGIYNILRTTPNALSVDPTKTSPVIHFATQHGLQTGDLVTYTSGTTGITGLMSGGVYAVIVVDPFDILLANNQSDAMSGKAIALNATSASGTQTLTSSHTTLTFDPSALILTLLNFLTPHLLHTGQALDLVSAGGLPFGGLTNKTYYAIVVDDKRIELALSYNDSMAGKAITLTGSLGSGQQSLQPEAVDVNAASRTIDVSIAGAYASSAAQGGDAAQLGVAGSISTNTLISTTKAYIANATMTTGQLNVTADHGDYIGSLTAGASGAAGKSGTAIAGSISVNLVLLDTEAFIRNSSLALSGNSNVLANEKSSIVSIAGSGAFGGKGGFGAAVALNLIGFSTRIDVVTNRPAQTLAYISNSTISLAAGTLAVLASNLNDAFAPRIISVSGALGIGTQQSSNAVAGMVAVNVINDETDAYLQSTSITQPQGASSAAVQVQGSDESWILAVGGAVAAAQSIGVGVGISYDQIAANTRGYLDSTTITINGPVSIAAKDEAVIGNATVGVGVSTGSGGLAGGGSISINQINNITDAHISNNSSVTTLSLGDISVTADDSSLIVSVAGGVAVTKQSPGVGAAISYNLIGNTITATIDHASITSAGKLNVVATSSPFLFTLAIGAAGSSKGFALGGSITVNSISNTLDAHITNSNISATGDITVNANEAATLASFSGGIGISGNSASVGASLAYNYLGGSFDPANPNVINNNTAASNAISAYIDNCSVTTSGALLVTVGYGIPTTTQDPTGVLGSIATISIPQSITSQLYSATVGGAGGDSFALGAAVSLNFIRNSEIAYIADTPANKSVQANSIKVAASDSSTIFSAAAGLAFAKKAAGGAAIATNDIGNSIRANIGNATVTTTAGDINVNTNSSSTIGTLAVGGAGAQNVAIAGSLAYNHIHNTTDAHISNASATTTPGFTQVTGKGSVIISAVDHSTLTVGAGGIAGADKVAAGISSATNEVNSTTSATINGATVTASTSNVNVLVDFSPPASLPAGLNGQINSLAAGGAGASTVSLAGSLALNWIHDTLTASIINNAQVNATAGNVNIKADDNATLNAASGAISAAGRVAVGASVAYNYLGGDPNNPNATNTNRIAAFIDHANVTAGQNVFVTATTASTINDLTVAGSGAGYFALGGAVSIDFIRDDLEGFVSDGSIVTGTTAVSILASDTASLNATAGDIALSGVAVGVSAAYNDIANRIQAYVGVDPTTSQTSGATVSSTQGNVTIDAESNSTIKTLAAGIAVSSQVGVAGSIAINRITDLVNSFINQSSNVTAGHSFNLLANSADTITAYGGTISGSESFGGGGTVIVDSVGSTTAAFVNNATVTVLSHPTNTNNDVVQISANNITTFNVIAVTATGGGSTGIGLNVVVNLAQNKTYAYLQNSTFDNQAEPNRTLSVYASEETDDNTLGGVLSGAGTAVGVVIDTDLFKNVTQAFISGGNVHSGAFLTDFASNVTSVTPIAVGVAASGDLGIAGSGSVLNSANITQAFIDGNAQVNADQNLNVLASDSLNYNTDDGALALTGDFGGSGTFTVGLFADITTADITNANAKSLNADTLVEADSFETLNIISVSGALTGTVGIGAAMSVVFLAGTTAASINSANVQGNSVSVHASDTVNESNILGSLGLGIAAGGLGAAVDIITEKDAVDAHVAGSTVTANKGIVDIIAKGNKSFTTMDYALAGGTYVGVNGSLAIINVGAGFNASISGINPQVQDVSKVQSAIDSNISLQNGVPGLAIAPSNSVSNPNPNTAQNAQTDTHTNGEKVDAALNANKNLSLAGEFANRSTADVGFISAGLATSAVSLGDINAFIGTGSNVTSTGNINVKATDSVLVHEIVGGLAASGGVSVGGSVGIVNLGDATQAFIDSNSSANSTGGSIVVTATYTDGAVDPNRGMIEAYDGAGGIVGLGAQVGIISDTASQNAVLGSNVNINQAQNLQVAASATRTLDVEAVGVAVGGLAAGASIAHVTLDGSTNASLGSNDLVGQQAGKSVGAVSVTATSTETAIANTIAIAAGIGSGTGNDSTTVIDPTVTSSIGTGSLITTTGAMLVTAQDTPKASATSLGINAGGLTVGVSLATTTVAPILSATTGVGVKLQAGSLTLSATRNLPSDGSPAGYAKAAAASGSLIGINATNSQVTSGGTTTAYVATNSTLAISGKAQILASSSTMQKAEVEGDQGGIFVAGDDISNASSTATNLAYLGAGVSASGGELDISSTGNDNNFANAISGSGGVVSGTGAEAHTSDNGTTNAYMTGGDNTKQITVATFNISSSHTQTYNAKVNTVNASLVGGSGSFATNDSTEDVEANVGNNSTILVQNLSIKANNTLSKPDLGDYNVTSGSGGILDLPAARSDSTANLTTHINIGDFSDIESSATTGTFLIAAENDIFARDSSKLDSGGVIAVASAESSFVANTDSALIDIGFSTLKSNSAMAITTLTNADVMTNADAKTYGLAGSAQGSTTTTINPLNEVHVHGTNTVANGYATLRSVGVLSIFAGQDSSNTMNNFNVVAHTDLWNKTVIPINGTPTANATLTQHDYVLIDPLAQVLGVTDVNLVAQRGNVNVDGQGHGKDLYRTVIAAIAKVVGQNISLDIEGGSSVSTPSEAGVTVNGIVRTGIQNIQNITIDQRVDYNNNSIGSFFIPGPPTTFTDNQGHLQTLPKTLGIYVDSISDGMPQPTLTVEDLGLSLLSQIQSLQQLAINHTGNTSEVANYQAQINQLAHQLVEFGLVDPNDPAVTDPTIAPTLLGGLKVSFINFPNIIANLGNINVSGDFFDGLGTLNSPGNAQIDIENNSPFFLRTNALTIPANTGGLVNYNGLSVTGNNGIIDPAGRAASFTSFITAANTAAPTVTVKNNFDPQSGGLVLSNGQLPPAPDMHIDGQISNLRGSVTLFNNHGSVLVEGIPPYSGAINALSVSITAGRDFVINSTGYQNIGPDPQATWLAQANANDSNHTPTLIPYVPPTPSATPAILANNNVFISAQTLNVAATIQSGRPDQTLTLSSSLNLEIANDASQYYLDTVFGIPINPLFLLSMASTDNIQAYYNAATGNIQVDNVAVQGGYMQLEGQIISTGSADLRVIDGYGHVSIANNTTYPVVINNISTGGTTGIEGKLVLIDTSKVGIILKPNQAPNAQTPDIATIGALTTTYTRIGSYIQHTDNSQMTDVGPTGTYTYFPVLNSPNSYLTTYGFSGGTTAPTRTIQPNTYSSIVDSLRSGTSYQPLANQRYFWVTGLDNQTTTTKEWDTKTTGIFEAGSVANTTSRAPDSSTTVALQNVPLLLGSYVASDPSSFAGYTYTHYNVNTSSQQLIGTSISSHTDDYLVVQYTYTTILKYYSQYNKDFNTHSVAADYPIGIHFIGYDSGYVSIQSSTNVLLQGNIENAGGSTTITSTGSINTIGNSEIRSAGINLNAATGIGNTGPIQTTLTSGLLNANTSAGNIQIENVGILNYGNISSNSGNISLSSDHSILPGSSNPITGGFVMLNSSNGTIGQSNSPVLVQTGNHKYKDGLSANAASDIFITEPSGDLYVDSVISATGNVSLAAPSGNIIDDNSEERIDTRTTSQLLSLWNSMELLDTGNANTGSQADAKSQLAALSTFEASQYRLYWQLRNVRPNGNGGFIVDPYNPNYTYQFTTQAQTIFYNQLAAAHPMWTATQINAAIQNEAARRTQLYQTLNTQFGGSAYNPNYVYTPTTNDIANLTIGASWTTDQLTYSISSAVLLAPSTVTRVESPNIQGVNVILTAGSNIGIYSGQDVIDLSQPLTTQQKLDLVSAQRGDISFTYAADGVTPTKVVINLVDDINLHAIGTITAHALGSIFLGSDIDANVNVIRAGAQARVRSLAGVFNGNTVSADISGSSIVLEGGGSSVGTVATPITVQLNGGTLTARALQNVYISAPQGNLNLDTIFAPISVQLLAPNGSINDGVADGNLRIRAGSLDLEAQSAGLATDLLAVQLDPTGHLSGMFSGDVFLKGLGVFNVTDLNGKNVTLASTGDFNLQHLVVASGNLSITSVAGSIFGSQTVAQNVTLSAPFGNIGTTDNYFTISQTFGYLDANAGGTVYLFSSDLGANLNIDQITAGTGVYLTTIGMLVNANRGNTNIIAPAFQVLTNAIGTPALPITTQVQALESSSNNAGTYIVNQGPLIIGGLTPADGLFATGPLFLTNDGPLTLNEDIISLDNINVLVPDSATYAANIHLASTASVISYGHTTALLAGDNIQADAGSTIGQNLLAIPFSGATSNDSPDAVTQVTITGDYQNSDKAPGTQVTLAGTIIARQILVNGGLGNDSFTLNANTINLGLPTGACSVIGGAGSNTFGLISTAGKSYPWILAGSNSGSVPGITFSNIQNLIGGAGNDLFQVSPTGSLSGAVNGGAGSNTLDYTGDTGPIVIDLSQSAATAFNQLSGNGIANIQNFLGNTNPLNQIFGPTAATTWKITGNNTGTIGSQVGFNHFPNLTGGAGNDTLAFSSNATLSGYLSGGAGINTLDYSTYNAPVVVDLRDGAVTAVRGLASGSVSNIQSAIGSTSNTNLLVGKNLDTVWNLTGINTGSAVNANGTFTFVAFQNISGGLGVDSFQFGIHSSLSGYIDGGAGAGLNTLDYTKFQNRVVADLSTNAITGIKNLSGGGLVNIQSILANPSYTNSLVGPNTDNTWNITASNAGSIGAISFAGFPYLTGGLGKDRFVIGTNGSIAGSIDGRLTGGSNTLDYSTYQEKVVIALNSNAATGIHNLSGASVYDFQNIVGNNNSTDLLVGPNASTKWNLSATNAGSLSNGVAFTGFPNLVGGAGNDNFAFTPNANLTGTLDGGAGANSLDYSSYNAHVVVVRSQSLASGIHNLSAGGYFNIQSINGNANGNNLLVGLKADSTWNFTGPNQGTATTTTDTFSFSSFQNIAGGIGNDTFQFTPNSVMSGYIDGGAGQNTLDYTGYGHRVIVDLSTSASTGLKGLSASGFASFQKILANPSFTNLLVGTNSDSTWTINGLNTGSVSPTPYGTLNFVGFPYLTGGTGSDRFVINSTGSVSGAIDGRSTGASNSLDYSSYVGTVVIALNTSAATAIHSLSGGNVFDFQSYVGNNNAHNILVGPDANTNWNLNAPNAGSLNNGVSFTGFPNLAGGAGNDDFVIAPNASISGSLDGKAGINTLDYSNWTTNVNVNLPSFSATSLSNNVYDIQNVFGGSAHDTITGSTGGGVLVGGASADTITGGIGRSVLIGDMGNDTILGGPNDDILIASSTIYDNNLPALLAILAEWQRADIPYASRVSDLQAGTGLASGNSLVWANSVIDDGGGNTLTGDAGTLNPGEFDWFFANLTQGHDTITDQIPGEKNAGFGLPNGPASGVDILVHPTNSLVRQTISPVGVFVVDDSGATLPIAGVPITVTISSGPSGATLHGIKTVLSDSNGEAIFSGLWVDLPGTYILGASSGTLDPDVSHFFLASTVKAANLQTEVAGLNNITLQSDPTTILTDLAAINNLASPKSSTMVTLLLAAGSYPSLTVAPPANVTLVLQGNGQVTIGNSLTAMTVNSSPGSTTINNVKLTTTGNVPTILQKGGRLYLRSSTVISSLQYPQTLIQVNGGFTNLGTSSEQGNNTFDLRNPGFFIANQGSLAISAIGNSFQIKDQSLNLSTLANQFLVADAMIDNLHSAGAGVVSFVPSKTYIPSTGSIQMGITTVVAGGVLYIESGNFTSLANYTITKPMTVYFEGGPSLSLIIESDGTTTLKIIGSVAYNQITVDPGTTSGTIVVKIKGLPIGTFSPTGKIIINGGSPLATIVVSSQIKLPVELVH